MRVLLDECVPARLRRELTDHSVRTATEAGWAGIKNGELLRRAAAEFDCFLTVDRNLQFQQNVASLPVAVLVLHADGNDLESLRPLMPRVRAELDRLEPRQLVNIRI